MERKTYYLKYSADELNNILDKSKNMEEYDDTEIKNNLEKKISMPVDSNGDVIAGEKDSILISDENGKLFWQKKGIEIVPLTQEEYDALESPDSNTLYIII